MDFSQPARREPQSDAGASVKDFDAAVAQKTPQPAIKPLNNLLFLQSFQLGLLRPEHRRVKLTVPAPRRFPLLGRTQDPGVQTIPSKQDTL